MLDFFIPYEYKKYVFYETIQISFILTSKYFYCFILFFFTAVCPYLFQLMVSLKNLIYVTIINAKFKMKIGISFYCF